MTRATIAPSPQKRRTRWLVPAALILLSLVPIIAGGLRLTELTGGHITPENARFFDSPIPVLIHIPTVTLYLVLGAFQFVPSLRRGTRGRLSWHRIAGRILVPTGLLAALVGPVDELTRALLIGASWVLSLAVAEYFIYRRAQGPARPSRISVRPAH